MHSFDVKTILPFHRVNIGSTRVQRAKKLFLRSMHKIYERHVEGALLPVVQKFWTTPNFRAPSCL
jgi:hypothetical protein